MYRPWFCVFLIALFTGCAGIDTGRLVDSSADRPDRRTSETSETRETTEKSDDSPEPRSFEKERQALFDQPYIDPLTDYLEEHGDDSERASVVRQVRDERARRCETIAREYAGEPATETALERYRAGYAYSCPEQVSAFAERLSRDAPENDTSGTEIEDSGTKEESSPDDQQALGDCYLLTSIRNYSAAREACIEPAQAGDTRSQANMALIAHAFEDYSTALEWAEKAAPASSEASYLMGRMFASGRGVEQNMKQAIYWYNKAASQGHREAKAALDRHRKQERPVNDT
ncbi:tetratricopeptide repeat protein [Marinobacter sp. HL-58]|uniref:tetratricopeptide repeat protein n=1 Tax=Marinobacter sp. HL-58 TaxID=1479237 RepID=UPI00068B6B2D|nr:tetratricopeptide repeat protein [Marinobacter sp. HL-58]KPP96750.1 MAG: Sel1 repeat [Marinobacter sp. HL-58]